MANTSTVLIVAFLESENEPNAIDYINANCDFIHMQLNSDDDKCGGTHAPCLETYAWCGRCLDIDQKGELFRAFVNAPFAHKENAIFIMECDNEDAPIMIYHRELTARTSDDILAIR